MVMHRVKTLRKAGANSCVNDKNNKGVFEVCAANATKSFLDTKYRLLAISPTAPNIKKNSNGEQDRTQTHLMFQLYATQKLDNIRIRATDTCSPK